MSDTTKKQIKHKVAKATSAGTVQNIFQKCQFCFKSSIFPLSFSPFVSSKRRMSHQAC